ncbi:MAG: ArsR/SmtB family transcription factor [Phycisphaerae bacterium]
MNALELLAQPVRLQIMQLIWDVERSAGEIAGRFQVTFGAVSQHLAKLRSAKLITQRRDGRTIYYRANREALGPLAPALEAMWRDQLNVLKSLAEEEERGTRVRGPQKTNKRAASRTRSTHTRTSQND